MPGKSAPQTKTLIRPFELKSLNEDGTFEGYGSVFGVKDSYAERVMPGAFKKSLKAHKAEKTMPKLLWQHDWDQPIGVWLEMSEDDTGLLSKGKLLIQDVQRAKEAHALLKATALDGLSIGYIPKAWRKADDDEHIIELTEVDLWEVSVVTFPANPAARVSEVRSADNIKSIREYEGFLRDVGGFSKEQAKSLASSGWAALERRDAGRGTDDEMNALASSIKRNLETFRHGHE